MYTSDEILGDRAGSLTILIGDKASESPEHGPGYAHAVLESCLQDKIFASESAVKCVINAMKVVGVHSRKASTPRIYIGTDSVIFGLIF